MNPEPPARPHGAGRLGFGERDDDATDASPLELEDILTTILETAYRWDFASDRIDWAANAQTVLGVGDPEMIGKGRAFALLVDPEHAGPRYDGITGGPHLPPGTELRYCLRYRFLPDGRRGRAAVWVEDTGVCAIDAESRPRLAQGTLRLIDNRRRGEEERLLYLGNHDELTGQLNRTRLTEELTRFLGTAGRKPVKGAFLLAGVNDLTLINETYGYDVGDEVITIAGRRIGRALRGRDCIGRFSSNKFGIVLEDCDTEGVEVIARRIMAAVRDSVIDTSVGAVATTLSVGAVLLPQHAGNAQTAIARALQALDLARHSHSDRLTVYQHCERRDSERRRAVAIADEVVRALNDRRMILALQPIVTSRSHEPELYECLLRMKRLDGTIASASEFIPVAEQFGLAKLVDHRALELAIELLHSAPDIKLALNVSAATATDPQWLQGLEAYFGKGTGLGRTPHHRDHRDGRHFRSARDRQIRGRAQGARLPRGARRFRRRLYVVPQSPAARRRHGQDRRLLHPESRRPGRGRAVRAHADRPRQELRHHHRWRMGGRREDRENLGEGGRVLHAGLFLRRAGVDQAGARHRPAAK